MDKEPVTPEWVAAKVENIKRLTSDPETAHICEDQLWEAVLYVIAEGECADPKACAIAALRTKEIDFPRWCA